MKCSYCEKEATYIFDAVGDEVVKISSCKDHIQMGKLQQESALHLMAMKERSKMFGKSPFLKQ
jgi:hypothetical protein